MNSSRPPWLALYWPSALCDKLVISTLSGLIASLSLDDRSELLIITKRWENIYLFVTIALIMDEYILWEREGSAGREGGREGGRGWWPDHVTKCW